MIYDIFLCHNLWFVAVLHAIKRISIIIENILMQAISFFSSHGAFNGPQEKNNEASQATRSRQHRLLQQAQHPPVPVPSQSLLFFPSDHIPMLCKFRHQFDQPLSSLCILHKAHPKQSPAQQEHSAVLVLEP